jgi:hypothetical protein
MQADIYTHSNTLTFLALRRPEQLRERRRPQRSSDVAQVRGAGTEPHVCEPSNPSRRLVEPELGGPGGGPRAPAGTAEGGFRDAAVHPGLHRSPHLEPASNNY